MRTLTPGQSAQQILPPYHKSFWSCRAVPGATLARRMDVLRRTVGDGQPKDQGELLLLRKGGHRTAGCKLFGHQFGWECRLWYAASSCSRRIPNAGRGPVDGRTVEGRPDRKELERRCGDRGRSADLRIPCQAVSRQRSPAVAGREQLMPAVYL
jgi:hypothetical protein